MPIGPEWRLARVSFPRESASDSDFDLVGTSNDSAKGHAPGQSGGVWIRLAASGAVVGGLLYPHPAAADDAPSPAPVVWGPAASAESTDCRLTFLARQALALDPLLAPVNVGVSVHAGSATLWGSLPSAAHARRAAAIVAAVPGMTSVQDETHIEPAATAPVLARPAAAPSGESDPRPSPVLTGRDREDSAGAAVELLPPLPTSSPAEPQPAAVLLPPVPASPPR